MGFKFELGQTYFYTLEGKKLEGALLALRLLNYYLNAALIIHHSDCCGPMIRA